MPTERLTLDEVVNIDCFVVPANTALPATLGVVRHASTIFELVTLVLDARKEDAPAIVDFPNLDILQLVNQKAAFFPIAAAVLIDVPGTDYEVLFNNSSYNLPQVGMLELIKAQTDIQLGANLLAQEAIGDKPAPQGVSRIEDKMQKRAHSISTGVVRRNITSAPEPVSLKSQSSRAQIEADDNSDDDI